MEWRSPAAAYTDQHYYHPFASTGIDNNILDFDTDNVARLLPGKSAAVVENATTRVNQHYIKSQRHIKRAFGSKMVENFQEYNWGLVLNVEIGLSRDKIELLNLVFSSDSESKLTETEFFKIVTHHSTYRKLAGRKKKVVFRDVKTCFKKFATKPPYSPCIVTKFAALDILEMTGIELDIDYDRLTRTMKASDAEYDRMHMLLLDDPLINGKIAANFPKGKPRFKIPTGTLHGLGDEPLDWIESDSEDGDISDGEMDPVAAFEHSFAEEEAEYKLIHEELLRKQAEGGEPVSSKALDTIDMEEGEDEETTTSKSKNDKKGGKTAFDMYNKKGARKGKKRPVQMIGKPSAATEALFAKVPKSGTKASVDSDGISPNRHGVRHKIAMAHAYGQKQAEKERRVELFIPNLPFAAKEIPDAALKSEVEAVLSEADKEIHAEIELARRYAYEAGMKSRGTGNSNGDSSSGDKKKTVSNPVAMDASNATCYPRSGLVAPCPGTDDGTTVGTSSKEGPIKGRGGRQVAFNELVTVDEISTVGMDDTSTTSSVTHDDSNNSKAMNFEVLPPESKPKPMRVPRKPPSSRRPVEKQPVLPKKRPVDVPTPVNEAAFAAADNLLVSSVGMTTEPTNTTLPSEHIEQQPSVHEAQQRVIITPSVEETKTAMRPMIPKPVTKPVLKPAGGRYKATSKIVPLKDRIQSPLPQAMISTESAITPTPAVSIPAIAKPDPPVVQNIQREMPSKPATKPAVTPITDTDRDGGKSVGKIPTVDKKEKPVDQKDPLPTADITTANVIATTTTTTNNQNSVMSPLVHDTIDTIGLGSTVGAPRTPVKEQTPSIHRPVQPTVKPTQSPRVVAGAMSIPLSTTAEATETPPVLLPVKQQTKPKLTPVLSPVITPSLKPPAATVVVADRPGRQEEADAVKFLSLLGEKSKHTSVVHTRPKTAVAKNTPILTPALTPVCSTDKERREEASPAVSAGAERRPKTAPTSDTQLSADEGDQYGSFLSLLENYSGELCAIPPKAETHGQKQSSRKDNIPNVKMPVGIPPVEHAPGMVELRPKSSGRARTPILLSPRSQAALDRPPKSPSPRAFEILDLSEPIVVPFPLTDLYLLPAQDIEVMVPKTNGQLRLQIRHDDEGDIHGLFVHGFRANCRAEELGLIKVGDELLKVNGEVVKGGYLEDVIAALKYHDQSEVLMLIRRHSVPSIDQSPADFIFDLADIHHNDDDSTTVTAERMNGGNEKGEYVSPRPYTVSNQPFSTDDDFPSLYALFTLPAKDIDIMVPKTNGQLRIQLRHDDEGDIHGLFVHGFRPFSKAEEQGIIRVADEIIKVNGVVVKGGYLEDVIEVLKDHTESSVSMVVRRFSADMRPGSRGSHLEHHMEEDYSPRAFQVTNFVGTDGTFPPLDVLFGLPSKDIKIAVPKTNGQLRIQLRHDDEGDLHGLFVHGFRPFSKVEAQGLVQVGDEIIIVNGTVVKGGHLEDVVGALEDHEEELVEIVVRRHYQKNN